MKRHTLVSAGLHLHVGGSKLHLTQSEDLKMLYIRDRQNIIYTLPTRLLIPV